ncbi:MAG: ATP-binding protein [Prevotellaceae bacterium]|jgi:hypothetical protein|nr:ATP-binding protein [Prevotellaceae bacterium]
MKKLPLGTQSFENLRKTDCVYVDKTENIHRLISEGRIYFLSRPRRFGKSLLISTLDALFRGRRELFEGLYIYNNWNWSQQYPVIRIDWTRINHSTLEEMKSSLCNYLRNIAKEYQVTLEGETAIDYFNNLIHTLCNQTGKNVVILIDEYDKPVTSHLFDPDLDVIRRAVHDFYQVMKAVDEYLQFVFITGVSKFSGLSVFSALNNLTDITLDKQFASICGYTQEELESNFSDYIDAASKYLEMTKEKIMDAVRYRYNGYTWDGKTSVYNPYSTMNFFRNRELIDYWFATGTPTFLIDIIQRRNNPNIVMENIAVDNSVFQGYNPPDINEIPLLFQTGYLTIKQKERVDMIPRYVLGMPNMEVNNAFMTCLLEAYGKYQSYEIGNLRKIMETQIITCDEAGFARSLEAMVATVPYEIHKTDEAYYHSMMLIWMRLLGFNIHGETSNNFGRADAVWEQPGVTVVAEIKYHAETKIDTLLNEAMKQIHDRRYYNQYLGKVILLGIAFSGKNVGCRILELRVKS